MVTEVTRILGRSGSVETMTQIMAARCNRAVGNLSFTPLVCFGWDVSASPESEPVIKPLTMSQTGHGAAAVIDADRATHQHRPAGPPWSSRSTNADQCDMVSGLITGSDSGQADISQPKHSGGVNDRFPAARCTALP